MNNKPIFLKLMIFTNFNAVFPVVVLVFDFEGFSKEVLHGHSFIFTLLHFKRPFVLYILYFIFSLLNFHVVPFSLYSISTNTNASFQFPTLLPRV
jgi:hypothetical protein